MELRICHLYPDVLNLYGDRGNLICMRRRLQWRGIDCHTEEAPIGSDLDFSRFDEEDLSALENWIGERTNMRRNFYRLNTIFDEAAPISSAKRAYC